MDELLSLKGVGETTLRKLHELNIFGLDDLAAFLPRDYMDFDSALPLEKGEGGAFVLSEVTVKSVSKPFRKGGLSVYRAYGVSDGGAKVRLTWYNSPFVAKHISEGVRVRVCGKLRVSGQKELINPAFEICAGKVKLAGIRPIYPLKGLIPQTTMQKIARDMLGKYTPESIIPESSHNKHSLMSLAEAVRAAHLPNSIREADEGRKRIALEELVKRIAAFKMVRESERRYNTYPQPASCIDAAERALPFVLSASQKAAVEKITGVLRSGKPLNAMLAGDVGSGKTAVAMLSAYFAVKNGYQAAFMAPTEILAVQHYNNFEKTLAPLGVRIALLCGSTPVADKRAVKCALESGGADIVIGTQALFSAGVAFNNLGLVIIDEQHRFGVAQRTALIDKGRAVDTLTLSATPIPRSLRLTMFGDIDIIHLERRHPADNITTAVVPGRKRGDMLEYIVKECEKGGRAFIVAPKIEEDGDGYAAEELYSELKSAFGKRVKIGLLHGRISPSQKIAAIRGFERGEIGILVSTTVVEVGVDVPDASIMAIMGAERFGLATLHQLRGRVGRNGGKAYCFLYTEKNPREQARLEIMAKETDGLAVAEKDYELRGAGDFLGESQSGRGFAGVNLPVSLVNLAASLAGEVDAVKYGEILRDYILRFGLRRITLS